MKIRLKQRIFGLGLGLLMFSFLFPLDALAFPAGIPFGGQILAVIPCVCSFNFLIIQRPIGATSPFVLIFQPFVSILYPFFNVWIPGTYLLGTYGPPDVCVIFDGGDDPCTPIMIAPLIIMTGTSAF